MSANKTTIFSVAALVLTFIGQLLRFLSFDYHGELSFYFSFYQVIYLLIAIFPCALFALFVLKLHEKIKPAIVFGAIAAQQVLYILFDLIFGYMYYSIETIIITLVLIIASVWSAIGATNGFPTKVYIIAPMVLALGVTLYGAPSIAVLRSCLEYSVVEFLLIISSVLGELLLYVGLLVYGLENSVYTPAPANNSTGVGGYDIIGGYDSTGGYSDCSNGGNSYGGLTYTSSESSYEAPSPIATVSATTTTIPDTPKCDPMKELTELKANLQNGTISQEEYDSRLADIMSKI